MNYKWAGKLVLCEDTKTKIFLNSDSEKWLVIKEEMSKRAIMKTRTNWAKPGLDKALENVLNRQVKSEV